MADTLDFDLAVAKGGFLLEAAAEIPLAGITALSGPSGAGKTTLLRALAGLEAPSRETVRFAGEDWRGLPAAKRGVGFVFQDARLFPHLSVAGNLRYGAARRGAPPDLLAAVVEALDLKGLLDRAPGTLSGGETRRVALGRALASAPRILFLDEPLTGLDRARKDELMPAIAGAVAEFRVPAIHVTHSAHETDFLADRILHVVGGRIAGASGAPPRLAGRAVRAGAGAALAFGDQVVPLGPGAAPGEAWAVPLGRSFLVSTSDPGRGNAALTVRGTVAGRDPERRLCAVEVHGQRLDLPWPEGREAPPEEGTRVWISLPRAAARPEAGAGPPRFRAGA